MRILLVEDDPAQCEPLQAALTHAGHVVDAVEDGTTARWLMGEKDYDLLIFDWMLPGEDGISLCQHYRQEGKAAPILI
ncbi:response regulator [Nodosilinea sp. LEGE 07298]|nr:response regulator [Nodosilinea sp. LEGE 07298]MBE9109856.1 response regulator [Nodosilinea sp. LEGE 07298]